MADTFPFPENEDGRRDALRDYAIAGTPPEVEFDHIAKLATEIFGVPTALISFVEKDRQIFKAKVGFDASETARDQSFCAHTIIGKEVMVVPDATADARFKNNPLVTAEPAIRFYAGAPLTTDSGHNIGSLCIIDSKPRPALTLDQQRTLMRLAEVTMDHLERRRLHELNKAAFSIVAAMPEALVGADEAGQISFWNPASETIFGYTRQQALGKPLETLVAKSGWHELKRFLKDSCTRRAPSRLSVEVLMRKRTGVEFMAEVVPASWEQDGGLQIALIVRDLSAQNSMRDHLRYLISHDVLTDLPNRSRFLEVIDQHLRSDDPFAVLKIGLDAFGTVNGSLGMAAGDRVLKQIADRIRQSVGEHTTVARLSGDEFGVLIEGKNYSAVAETIHAAFKDPVLVSGLVAQIGASVGIVSVSSNEAFKDANSVLKAALLALHEAKAKGGATVEVYRHAMSVKADGQRRLAEDLKRGFEAGELELFFQPQIDLENSKIVGAEALLRWRHPQRGLISPGEFIPVLEVSNIATRVGQWILESACRFAAQLASDSCLIRVGVNLFAVQLRDPDIAKHVQSALWATGLSANLLELEITETTVLRAEADVLTQLNLIRELGVGIAFDDYGTGYASLSLLKRYPLTRLKIDREFVKAIDTTPADTAIVEAVLKLGRSLGLEVIAEGMETNAQAHLLKSLGCRFAQGYLYGKPMTAAEFHNLARQTHVQPTL
ncbi:sensor domain-containing phosphodiesterase [Shinella sedimenti]|uniref:EAL domain-containing protein n=1 Tax=Shinella sedimenti TaxID=2919913 RepID=A0ABT0CT43_9HYPH|nr:EAL domain-containing protein [Shinella sedimenti]MCJ8151775.1 EAL domain-containing protein [Shinella sedimenti]